MKNNPKKQNNLEWIRFEISFKEINLNKIQNISGVEGTKMFLYLSYTKIIFYLEIVKFKMIQMSGYGTLNR